MIKTHIETVQEPKVMLDSIICNKCGKEIQFSGNLEYRFPTEEYITIKHTFGYFANQFLEGDGLEAHICENCMMDFVKSFVISADT